MQNELMRHSIDLTYRLSRDPRGMATFSGLRPNSPLPYDALLSGKGNVREEKEEEGRGKREKEREKETTRGKTNAKD